MSASAATWFYQQPEQSPYLLAERVRGTFWDMRYGGLWFDAVKTDGPFVLEGTYNGAHVKMEWEPGKWLRLSTAPAAPSLKQGVSVILRRKPALQYGAEASGTVWEWWLEGSDKRWQEIQGKPAYRNPKRLAE